MTERKIKTVRPRLEVLVPQDPNLVEGAGKGGDDATRLRRRSGGAPRGIASRGWSCSHFPCVICGRCGTSSVPIPQMRLNLWISLTRAGRNNEPAYESRSRDEDT